MNQRLEFDFRHNTILLVLVALISLLIVIRFMRGAKMVERDFMVRVPYSATIHDVLDKTFWHDQ